MRQVAVRFLCRVGVKRQHALVLLILPNVHQCPVDGASRGPRGERRTHAEPGEVLPDVNEGAIDGLIRPFNVVAQHTVTDGTDARRVRL